MINQIESSLTQVDHILHIADIHIRNWKRHKEYLAVFERLYSAVDQLPANSIVTIGGDIVHAKTDMSPELITMVSNFFTELADRAPTILIAGNHDANLNNNFRMDALTPIVEAVNHPNLFYLRDSGVYKIGDTAISVMSLLQDRDQYVTADNIELDDVKHKVAMYHGTIANSQVDSGLKLTHGLAWDNFAGYDIALLGDIHKRQLFSASEPLMFYPSSLVQQNFGESFDGHGYALVNMNGYSYEFVDLENEYGYYTAEVDNGVLPPNLPITSKTSLRLKTSNTTAAQLKRVLASIRKLYRKSDVTILNLDKIGGTLGVSALEDSILHKDVRNPQTQKQLLVEYMEAQGADQAEVDLIVEINDKLSAQLVTSEVARGIVWKPRLFKFSNMFSYGEDNEIDFDRLEGTCGLFAPNHAGKSAILDALCFCLFDSSPRATRADQVLNNKSDWFSCELQFEIESRQYFIKKYASRYKKGPLAGRLRVDIDFWTIGEDGEAISLNGEQRRDTGKVIQTYVGTLADFVLTSMSSQGNSSNFIEKTQAERKDLLVNFLDLTIFDQLYELANKEARSASVLLEEYQKTDFETAFGDAERTKDQLTVKIGNIKKEIADSKKSLKSSNEALSDLYKDLQANPADGLDIDSLNITKADLQTKDSDLRTKSSDVAKLLQELAKEASDTQAEIDNLDHQFDPTLHVNYSDKLVELTKLEGQLDSVHAVIVAEKSKLAKLEEHEYDPNCSYCVNNVFVKDAINTKSLLIVDQSKAEMLESQLDDLRSFLEANQEVQQLHIELADKNQRLTEIQARLEKAVIVDQSLQKDLELNSHKQDTNQKQIETYQANKSIVEKNTKLQVRIDSQKDLINDQESELDILNTKQTKLYADLQQASAAIKEALRSIDHMQQLGEKVQAYNVYLKAVSKDGIPYHLISQAVPYIQDLVNTILSQVVDFNVLLDTDGKNINTLITYDGTQWPLELASGMERFVASLAIRVAMIKTTNLPKPDFIAVDEGLGVLDASNLNSMHMLFSYLKDVFKFSLIISHIDVVRDMVDLVLTIDRKEDFSYIRC